MYVNDFSLFFLLKSSIATESCLSIGQDWSDRFISLLTAESSTVIGQDRLTVGRSTSRAVVFESRLIDISPVRLQLFIDPASRCLGLSSVFVFLLIGNFVVVAGIQATLDRRSIGNELKPVPFQAKGSSSNRLAKKESRNLFSSSSTSDRLGTPQQESISD
ncbi:hypothetical protein PGTUg99_012817 [Puccinia graminis f. sp. tritici]|uniref:Uncharacterized protein n=1 Tax=Puccinia graminis f. sp. tritici TaxID=56615 RepID=A0A5B0S742_PUCGR|nr:hypothetical protein PGTUg99_012817 [Puccinia graminis f. sp. tritici]